ncbi:hypothetical protein [Pectinatus frisingensis]|uniref:hypothetical protein n=1 Tax=Pectinatus frisingensis TaxID=865 RepID=UPI0015F4C92B|nr:hypothetical protein [Pectinatus frisingensis]
MDILNDNVDYTITYKDYKTAKDYKEGTITINLRKYYNKYAEDTIRDVDPYQTKRAFVKSVFEAKYLAPAFISEDKLYRVTQEIDSDIDDRLD